MSSITGTDNSALTGTALSPQQQAEMALFGGGTATPSVSSGETSEQQANAALVDLSAASTVPSLGSQLANGATPQEAEASELVSSLAADISSSGSGAASIYSQLSAYATYALTKS
jgi:hypothetical protein